MIYTTLLNNWNLMRWLRLLFGLYLGYQAFVLKDSMSGFLGAFLLIQAITNTGCCGSGGCSVPAVKNKDIKSEEPDFEIIKP